MVSSLATCLFALLLLVSRCESLTLQGASSAPTSAVTADSTAIRKVITLIEEMKEQVEKDAAADQAASDKFQCWCKTNEEAKTEAISNAERRIDELTFLIEELAAREAQLKTEISGLAQDIADDQEALSAATAVRQKEHGVFVAEEADLKETLALLKEAVGVLSKVQLLQQSDSEPRIKTILMQVQHRLRSSHPEYENALKKDLFDILGAFEDVPSEPASHGFLPRQSAALIHQHSSLLPWEKTDEQIGRESKSTDLVGSVANAKSYNTRSGRVIGLLREMGDETARDLADAQKLDLDAEIAYQHLRAAKEDEISAATQHKTAKEAELAVTLDTAAKSKEDKETTMAALDADQKFLANLLKDCKTEDEEFKERSRVRSEELVALAETLRILNEDDARDLFGKTVSLLQIDRSNLLMERSKARVDRAVQKIADVARKHKNWALVSLAVRVRLDAFEKVKEAIDKMSAELARQQKEEYAKWELCKANIDSTEDSIKVGNQVKEDLAAKHKDIVNSLESLARDLEALKAEVEQMKVSLKEAGEERKAQNAVFQQSVSDQRATTNILNKALARLRQFYVTKSELLQVRSSAAGEQPGRAVEPMPTRPGDYAKSAGAGGVVQLLMKIIENSEVASQQLVQDEQRGQTLYAEFVQSTTATIEVDRAAIAEKMMRVTELNGAKADTEQLQLSNNEELDKLSELLKAYHLDCDYLIKYFDVRQQARAEEMDALTDAKAVFSGANFK